MPAAGHDTHCKGSYQDPKKLARTYFSNISVAKAVPDTIRTRLGPKGIDKVVQDGQGDVNIRNDGATILKQMQTLHPAARNAGGAV